MNAHKASFNSAACRFSVAIVGSRNYLPRRSACQAVILSSAGQLAAEKPVNTAAQLVAYAPEHREPIRVRAGCRGRIVDAPVHAVRGARKRRTRLVRAVTHRDDVIPWLVDEAVECLGRMRRHVDADLTHRDNRERMHRRLLGTGARDVDAPGRMMPQQAFGHLAAR
jgi:hypothetical protein